MICSRVLYRVPCFHFSSFAGLWGEWPSPFMSRNLVLTRYRTVVFSVYSHGVRHIAEQQRPGELDEPMRILRPSPVGCMLEEVVRPSNAIHLAPFYCEELSWHFMQPAGVHDQEHSRRRLISRHSIRRSAVQAQYTRGYPLEWVSAPPGGCLSGASGRTPELFRASLRDGFGFAAPCAKQTSRSGFSVDTPV